MTQELTSPYERDGKNNLCNGSRMSGGVAAGSRRREPAAIGRALWGVCLLIGAPAHGQRRQRRGGDARGVPRSGPARAQAAEDKSPGRLAVPRHGGRLPKAQSKARRRTAAAVGV